MPRIKEVRIYEVCTICRRSKLESDEEKHSLICERCTKKVLKTDAVLKKLAPVMPRPKCDYWS